MNIDTQVVKSYTVSSIYVMTKALLLDNVPVVHNNVILTYEDIPIGHITIGEKITYESGHGTNRNFWKATTSPLWNLHIKVTF